MPVNVHQHVPSYLLLETGQNPMCLVATLLESSFVKCSLSSTNQCTCIPTSRKPPFLLYFQISKSATYRIVLFNCWKCKCSF